MNALATAADFKNGFGTQFVQPFPDTDALYSSYSHYNNWAAKVPSPLGKLIDQAIVFELPNLSNLQTNPLFPLNTRYKDIPLARQPLGLGRVIKPPPELNQLLQLSIIFGGCKYEYNNVARHNGLELNGIRKYGWSRRPMSLYDTNKSIHVPSPHHG
jgi:hypothetical protein